MADALMLLATGGESSSSSHQSMRGGVGDDAQGAEQNIPGVQPRLSNRSDSAALKNFLRECHVGAAVVAAIPEGLGLGMFISLSRDDIHGLSVDVGI
jgi:hypothetical protein